MNDTKPVYAESESCSNRITGLIIDDNGIQYPEGTDESTAIWDQTTATLTLNNYDGASICFEEFKIRGDATIVLNGNNIINDALISTYEGPSLIVSGDGTLSLRRIAVNGGALIIRGGNIVVNDGEAYATLLLMENGSLSSPYAGAAAFIQRGGVVNLLKDYEDSDPILETVFAYIDGGITNIKNDYASQSGTALESEYYASTRNLLSDVSARMDGDLAWIDVANLKGEGSTYHYEVPVHSKFPIYFAGGDISIDGTIVSSAYAEDGYYGDYDATSLEEVKDWLRTSVVGFSNDMIIEPEITTTAMEIVEEGDDNIKGENWFTATFVDDLDGTTPVSSLHIYKSAAPIPVPSTDDTPEPAETEENPYTIDSHLFSIISTILVSIVAEVFIIIDLKKRINNTQDQIVEIETKTLFDPIDSISSKPEEK